MQRDFSYLEWFGHSEVTNFGEAGKQEVCYSVFRMRLSGRRGRIQIAGTADCLLGQQIITVLPRAFRDGQNPLPHKWLDHHGGTSRNSVRSNELARLLAESEREAEPSAARPQLTRNGSVAVEAHGNWTHKKGAEKHKNSYEHWEPDKTKREVSNTVSASGNKTTTV